MPFTIREAVFADASSIARVHLESWRTTYQGLVDDGFLNAMRLDERRETWKHRLAYPDPDVLVLAACDEKGNILGFATAGPERTENLGCDGELYAIYLAADCQRQGLGKQLVFQTARSLNRRGMQSLSVWVLSTNPSRAFYEALGAKYVMDKPLLIGEGEYIEAGYVWKDLSPMLGN